MLGVAAVIATLGATMLAGQAWAESKVLTMAVPGNAALDNLDPRILLSTSHQAVQMAIFDSLVRSKGTEIVPAAAEKWEISPDGKTYTFHLRAAKWSDGKPVTGQDFVDAFVRMFTTSGASIPLTAFWSRQGSTPGSQGRLTTCPQAWTPASVRPAQARSGSWRPAGRI